MVKRVRAARWLAGVFAASVVAGAASPASAQRTTGATAGSLNVEEPAEGVVRSSCVLMLRTTARLTGAGISNAGPTGLADLTALTTAMTTTGLIDPAAKAALALGPREWPKVVRIEVAPAGSQAVKLSVSVDPSPNTLKQDDPAGALLRELVERAKNVVRQSAEARRLEARARLDEFEKRRVELRTSLESLRKRSREADPYGYRGGMGPGDPVVARRQQLEMELTAKRPRLQAIREILPRVAAQPDEMGTALRGLVAAREALVAGLEKAVEQGKGDPVELLRARAELAEARVRAAEGGRNSSSPPSRNVRDEQVNLEVDIASIEAQLKALRPTSAEPARPPAEDPQVVRAELMRAENEYNTLEMQYRIVRRDADQLASPQTLVVLDGLPR